MFSYYFIKDTRNILFILHSESPENYKPRLFITNVLLK